MTELKHTLGPLYLSKVTSAYNSLVNIHDENRVLVASMMREPDARLYAEAPAMVENVLLKLLNPANLNSAGIAKIIDESAQILTRMEGKEE